MVELELTVTVGEGDVLRFNDVWWEVESLTEPVGEKADMIPMNTGKLHCLSRDEIEERVEFSGELHLVRADYREVIDY